MLIDRRQFVKLAGASLLAPFTSRFSTRRPTTRSPVLSRFYVAGFRYYRGLELVDRLRAGDAVELRAEPDNPYDRRAIEIYWGQHKLGYVPRKENRVLSRLLAQGVPLRGHITHLQPQAQPWEMVRVRVAMPGGR